jgi:hypothetical protein
MEVPSAIFSASLFVRSFMKSHYTKCLGERQCFHTCLVSLIGQFRASPLAGRCGAVYALIRPEEDEAVEGERASTRRGDCE